MSSAVTEKSISFPVEQFDSSAVRETVLALKIADTNDKEGKTAVREWRIKCKKTLAEIEKTREKFKKVWLEGGRKVDAEAKRLAAEWEPLEQHCIDEEQRIADELAAIEKAKQDAILADRTARWNASTDNAVTSEYLLSFLTDKEFVDALELSIAAFQKRQLEAEERARALEKLREQQALIEAAKKRQELISARCGLLAKYGEFPDPEVVADMTDEQYQAIHGLAETAFHERKAKAEAEEKAEKERVAKIASENAERIRQQQIKDAADRAAKETEERLKRQAEVAERERQAEIARKEKEAALAPAKDKLNTYSVSIMEVTLPDINQEVNAKMHAARLNFIRSIGRIANELE